MSLDAGHTSNERERAFSRFEEILNVHNAAIETIRIVAALPNASDLIAASVRLRKGMSPELSAEQVDGHATLVLDILAAERKRDFDVVRASALVAVCGAFEYLVKATFVDQAAGDRQQAAGLLAKTRLRVAATDVLGVSVSEQWFAIADRLFEHLSEAHPQMHDRVQKFLLNFTCMPYGDSQKKPLKDVLDRVDSSKFNEAFLVRNCLVHNGGRVSTQLARVARLTVGDPISLSRPDLQPMLLPIRELAQALNALWIGAR